jgi:tetratricopeptide (TPR) repeat protein
MALTPGTRFGPYEIVAPLGAGGMGVVYKARDTRLDRTVAIKLLPEESSPDPARRQRFEHEARMLAALNHPHIVTLYSVERVDDLPVLSMEYVEGQALSALIPQDGFPVPQLLRIAVAIADALAAAHQRGVVHRDLKPSNVMVTADGWVKVLDLGLAKLRLDLATTRSTTLHAADPITAEGHIVGTVHYMSPEQAQGQAVDHRSDLFSLGVMLYELATGERPFSGSTPLSVLSAILKDTPRSVTELRPHVPPELARLIRRCLEKNPSARLQSALDVRHELEDLQERLRSESVDATRLRGLPGRPQLKRLVLWVGPALLLLAGAGLWRGLHESGMGEGWWPLQRPALALGARDTVLLGTIENTTGDPALEGAIRTALEISLEQSRQVSLLAPDRVRQTLRRMRRAEDETLTEDLAREVCQREGSRVLIAGSATRVADQYVLSVRIVDPATGAAVRTLTARAASRDRILPALDEVAASVRRQLGESLAAVAASSVKLSEATTSSLDALGNYSQGSLLLDRGRRDDARGLLVRAVALDPEFALAHAALASTYRGYGFRLDDVKAEHHFQEALKRLDRVTERERLAIQALYEGVMGRYGAAVNFHRQLAERYPNDAAYHFALAQDYWHLGRPRDAIAASERALELNPSSARIMVTLAGAHGELREWTKAARSYENAIAAEPTLATDVIVNHQYGWALVASGRPAEGAAAVRKMLDLEPSKRARGRRSLGILALSRGQLRDAARELDEARRLNEADAAPNSAARDAYYAAEGFLVLGTLKEGVGPLVRGTALSTRAAWTTLSLRLAALGARAGRLAEASRIVEANRKKAAAGDLYERSDLLRAEAELALARGKTAEAVELIRQAVAIQPWILTRTSLARMLARAGQRDEAVAEYEAVVAKGPDPWEGHVEWAASHLALARLYLDAKRRDDAKRVCGQLREVWKDADRDLPAAQELGGLIRRLE